MKRLLAVFVFAALALCGCGKTTHDDGESRPRAAFLGSAEQILSSVIGRAIELDADSEYSIAEIDCYTRAVDETNCVEILGLTPEEFTQYIVEAVESKPEDSWQPHSVVLVEAVEGVDTQELAERILGGTSPSRFGCLRVEAITVGCSGSYIVLAATSDTGCDAVYAAFEELSELPSARFDRENDWSDSPLI